jgi:hypothetical protein
MEKKKGMKFREEDGTEKKMSVEIEKKNIERKCLDSENNSSWPFSLNLAEKNKKDLKEDELAKERVGKTLSSKNVFAHPRKFHKEKKRRRCRLVN